METKEEHIAYIMGKSENSRKIFDKQMKGSLFSEFEKITQKRKLGSNKEIDNADLS